MTNRNLCLQFTIGHAAYAGEIAVMLFDYAKGEILEEVAFEPGGDYIGPWHIYDRDGRLDLTLMQSYDRTTRTKILWIDNCRHQIFGEFRGKAVLDDGRVLNIDKLFSFAEHAVNNW